MVHQMLINHNPLPFQRQPIVLYAFSDKSQFCCMTKSTKEKQFCIQIEFGITNFQLLTCPECSEINCFNKSKLR